MRRLFLRNSLFPAFLILVLICLFTGCNQGEKEKCPNIILILADDLGYGDPGYLNPDSKIPTPNLDDLAKEGISFTDAHAPASVCTPTRYGILTGRYPWRSRMKQGVLWTWSNPLIEEDRLTIGKMLQMQGYTTACIGKWHLGWNWPTYDSLPPVLMDKTTNVNFNRTIENGPVTRGFNYYFGVDIPSLPPHCFIENDRVVASPDEWYEGPGGAPGPMISGWKFENLLPTLTKKAIEYIEDKATNDPKHPFFLFFSLSSPHTPIAPADEFIGKSKAGRYGDFVFQTDYSIGKVLRTLDRLNIADNTLVIFTSDNGAVPFDGTNYVGEFGSIYKYGHNPNGDLRGVKSDAWEGGHREPFIARWPGHIPAGKVSGELLSLTDLMATFAALTGFKLPDSTAEDSYNMLDIFLGSGSSISREAIITQSGNGILSIQQGDWKLITSSGSGGSWSEPRGELTCGKLSDDLIHWSNIQLYNLSGDLQEKGNLADRYPEKVNELIIKLAQDINNGRSTPGPVLKNDGPKTWTNISWITGINSDEKQ
jgi:arylsulfatase A